MNIENYLFDNKWNKLIKPLEEYLLELAKKNPIFKNFNVDLPGVSILGVHETILISKKFGFIKWLVEKDKIDWRKFLVSYYEIAGIDGRWEDTYILETFDDYEQLLMYLAIQDEPISFLISILN